MPRVCDKANEIRFAPVSLQRDFRALKPDQIPQRGSRRRGRPSKFGRPSRVVALTLPEDAIERLGRVHRDIGWAIVKVLDKDSHPASARGQHAQPDVELVTGAERRSLIVVNREVIGNLPGVNIIPLSGNRAFLALDIDRGMSDVELAVIDRLADPTVGREERKGLGTLRAQLATWRRDDGLQFHTRAIIQSQGSEVDAGRHHGWINPKVNPRLLNYISPPPC